MNLAEMSIAELKELALQIKRELTRRQQEVKDALKVVKGIDRPGFLYHFKSEYGRREQPHYIAKLHWNKGLQYSFANLDKSYGDKKVVVFGDIKLTDGDLVEMRTDDGQYLYLAQNQQLIKLGSKNNPDLFAAVKAHLKYGGNPEQLLEIIGLKDPDLTVPDELKEE